MVRCVRVRVGVVRCVYVCDVYRGWLPWRIRP